MDARETAEAVARDGYGRLVAALAARSRDLAAAEDALGDAFLAALKSWPEAGIPANPAAWLLAVARRRLIDDARRARVRAATAEALARLADAFEEPAAAATIPDERLKLLFVCAHPAIDAAARTPLMLQTVLGLDAARIGSAFLAAPATMGQRLVRAKAKIRDAGIPFEVPEPADLPGRLDSVLEAIYAAFGTGWDDLAGADARRKGLAAEAIRLAGLVVDLLPDEPEARGLLALMLHCESRRAARRGPAGEYIPLSEQDVSLWSPPLIGDAERHLAAAARAGAPGRYQIEAAIQSAHAQRARGGRAPWEAILLLYRELVRLAPGVGAIVGLAGAQVQAGDPAGALATLDGLPAESIPAYQPYWAVRASAFSALGRTAAAADAYDRAIGLCEDDAVRTFLLGRRGGAPGPDRR